MAAAIDIVTYSDVLVLLATAGVVVPVLHRIGVNPMLGYLGAGAVLGPLGLGSLIDKVPLLYWVTVVDAENVAEIAELGVVFLLFVIGLELSYERLRTMRRLLFGLGTLQIVVSTAVIGGIAALFGNSLAVSVILGACLALSSTAIVIELLSEQGRLVTAVGRTSLSVLLAQDLAVVPLLVFVSLLGSNAGHSVVADLVTALVNASVAIALIIILGRLLLRPLFRLVASVTAGARSWPPRSSSSSAPESPRRWRACRWGWVPSSRACCWPRPSSAAPSNPPWARSRGCCWGCSSLPSA